MAAKLKKRALAEYQSQVLVEDKTEKTKRLKLTIRKDSSDQENESILLLDADSAAKDVINVLVNFSGSICNFSLEVLNAALKKINELLMKEKDTCVRVKLVTAWGNILSQEKMEDVSQKVDEMLEVNEESTKVTGAWLVSMKKILTIHTLNKCLKQKLFALASSLIHSAPHPTVHSKALALLAILVSPDMAAMSRQVVELCGSYSMSQDARVRTAAFHGLLTIHKRGVKLDVSMYPVFCTALTDDYEGVRCEALKLLSALAETDPEFQVELEGDANETIRMVDDVFSRTCQAINDVREQVRGLAAKLIGNMKNVSQVFMEQTLDKKLMSNMRVKKSAHERMNNLISSGEWSSGKKWADDAPKEQLDADQVNLVALGSCGAFVHGLEDECLSVRVASVDSLTKLAICNQDLAFIALDFLVDMFNDEIEQVLIYVFFF